MQTEGQFSPDQMIIAGRRAEAQGQTEYALQFYRYVADQYGATTEAYEARDALYRLTQPQPDPNYPQPSQRPLQQGAAPNGASQSSDPRSAPVLMAGQSLGADRRQPSADAARLKPRRQRLEASDDTTDTLPPRAYRIGRMVAAMLNTIGWLLLLSVLVGLPAIVAALTVSAVPKAVKEMVTGNLLPSLAGAGGALLIGLFAVFAAQVARATFDTADAARALLLQSHK